MRVGRIGHELVAVGPGLVGSLHVAAGFGMNPLPVQPAKIHCPPARDDTLSRERLNSWLERATAGRLALIVAEAGFGKTTLLADWSRQTQRVTAWYRLEDDDRDWLTFIRHLVASVRELDPEFAPATYAMLLALGSGGPTPKDLTLSIAREMAEFGTASSRGLTLIIDDYHLVDGFAETESIVRALLDRTGPGFSIVIASRSMPTLPLGRLKARGGVQSVDSRDLSFDTSETRNLFWDAYGQRIEAELINDLCSRTGGWAALLLWARTQIDERGDARAIVARIDATRGDVYEFLAEEVLSILDPALQRFLTRASVLTAVERELVQLVDPLSSLDVDRHLASAERLGLLSRPDSSSPPEFHPLVRAFLASALSADIGVDAVRDLHAMLGRALRGVDWHSATWHFREAGMVDEASDTLDTAISVIVATGQIERARPFLDGSAGSVERPGALILRSRLEIERGSLERAAELAELAVNRSDGSRLSGLAVRNLSAMFSRQGFDGRSIDLAERALASDLSSQERQVAEATVVTSSTQEEGDFEAAVDFLTELARVQDAQGHRRYAAVTRLNLSVILLWMGRPVEAVQMASRAESWLMNPQANAERVAAVAVRVAAATQLGDVSAVDALLDLLDTATTRTAREEAAVEVARLFADYGSLDDAMAACAKAPGPPHDEGYRSLWAIIRATLALRRGDDVGAAEALSDARGVLHDAAGKFRLQLVATRIQMARQQDARDHLEELHRIAKAHRSRYCESIADLIEGLAGDPSRAIGQLMPDEQHLLSIVAEEVVRAASRLDGSAWMRVEAEANLRPERWASALRLVFTADAAAARLLAAIGSDADAVLIRQAAASNRWLRPLAADIARRLAPPVVISDLGIVGVLIGGQPPSRPLRRKVLALLCFLSIRPGMAATRDEALEAIWPDLNPDTAINSLHQTIYFLRRVIEPGYREGLSARYVEFDGEIVTLDGSLFTTTSRHCWHLVERARAGRSDALRELLATYTGTYALDFAYEDWTASYRETLHAAVLAVAEAGIANAVRLGENDQAVELAQRVLAIDPQADAIELELLRAYKASGRQAAAAEQYSHYASFVREELGAEPPRLEDL